MPTIGTFNVWALRVDNILQYCSAGNEIGWLACNKMALKKANPYAMKRPIGTKKYIVWNVQNQCEIQKWMRWWKNHFLILGEVESTKTIKRLEPRNDNKQIARSVTAVPGGYKPIWAPPWLQKGTETAKWAWNTTADMTAYGNSAVELYYHVQNLKAW